MREMPGREPVQHFVQQRPLVEYRGQVDSVVHRMAYRAWVDGNRPLMKAQIQAGMDAIILMGTDEPSTAQARHIDEPKGI